MSRLLAEMACHYKVCRKLVQQAVSNRCSPLQVCEVGPPEGAVYESKHLVRPAQGVEPLTRLRDRHSEPFSQINPYLLRRVIYFARNWTLRQLPVVLFQDYILQISFNFSSLARPSPQFASYRINTQAFFRTHK